MLQAFCSNLLSKTDMSLINQALKLEQQRRHTETRPAPPMVTRAYAAQRRGDRFPLLLVGFTGLGTCLALGAAAFFYFGSQYLEGESSPALASSQPSQETAPVVAPEQSTEPAPQAAASENQPQAIESLIGSLSQDQLTTVQKMLLEREQAELLESSQSREVVPATTEELIQTQALVDSFSVQGIRKAGVDTRVFLNGKIKRLGDVVDIGSGLKLVGFNETSLVFEDPNGNRYAKAL